MLFGTDAWEVNMSYPRGFVTICSACGKGQGVELRGDMWEPEKENDLTTAPSQLCVIIECKECNQVVRVFGDGTSRILVQSDRVKEYEDNLQASLKKV
jgi:hypothetical protein